MGHLNSSGAFKHFEVKRAILHCLVNFVRSETNYEPFAPEFSD